MPIETENVRIEQNGGNRRSDISKKEQSMRRGSKRERDQVKEKKEIRDVSVGAPDTKESSCQTRESLFQAGTASSEGKHLYLKWYMHANIFFIIVISITTNLDQFLALCLNFHVLDKINYSNLTNLSRAIASRLTWSHIVSLNGLERIG